MIKFFITRPIFAIVISIVIVLLGTLSIEGLPVEQYPNITPPVVEVSASYPGADANTVNDAVAIPLSQSVMGVSDMLYMQATSSNNGTMNLQVSFDIDSDPDMDAVFTQNNVASATAQLPSSVRTQGVTTQKAMSGFLAVFCLYSDGRYDGKFLSNYAYINIQNELLKINGVGKVEIMGAGEYAMRIWVHPDALSYYNLSIGDITQAIESQSGVHPAGQLGAEPAPEGTMFTYTVTLPPQIDTPEAYGDIVLKMLPDGSRLRLRDVADIDLGTQSYGTSSLYGTIPGSMIVVYQTPGSNAVNVGNQVKSTMEKLSERFIDGVDYALVVDTTASIKAGIHEIFLTLLLALVLVILIIYLFIQDWRATLIPLIAIPVSLVGAFLFFPPLGFSVNIISLLGLILAIGLVVDDAIVVVEAVQVNIEKGMDPRNATIDAMKSVGSPIIATTVVLAAVFIPVSFIGGIVGKLYQQFSITIAVSVILSSFNALTLSPALCVLLLKPRKQGEVKGFFGAFNRWFDRRVEGYLRFSSIIVRRSVRVMLFVVVIGGAMYGLSRWLPAGFLPEEDQGYLMVMVNLPEAASLQRTQKAIQEIETIVSAHPEIAHTSSAAGFNMLAGVASTNCGILFVELVDYSDRKRSAQELADLLNAELYDKINDALCYAFTPPSIPGLGITSGITFMVQDRGGRGIGYLASQTQALLDTLRQQSSVASATTQFNDGVPQRRIEINKAYAQREGVSMDEVYTLLSTYLGGSYLGNFSRFGRLYDTYIQAAPAYRQNKEDLKSYVVTNGDGESVPLSAFVTIHDTVGVSYITTFNLYTAISVTVVPAKGHSSTQVMDLIEEKASELPSDIGIAWSGISYQEKTASGHSSTVYLLALVFVFLALAALYNSWSLPLSILLGVPFALFGALLFVGGAHLINPVYTDDLFMQVSLVMLIGLAAKNAILIIEYADRLFFEQGLSLADAAIGAARLRVRPIIMTAFAFILGVLPLVFAHGAYSTARNIMGVALIGGMLVATLLGIFVYPALYYAIGRISGFEKKRQQKIGNP